MDTSETYIKMCDCEEIQELAFKGCRNSRDYWYEKSRDGDIVEVIWLPRQDQLQEMVGGYSAGHIDWAAWIWNTYQEEKNPFKQSLFTSFEQLWLAFVMKEKFSKVWVDSGWVAV